MAEPAPAAAAVRPAYVDRRIELFEEFAALERARLEAIEKKPIKVTFVTADGDKTCEVPSWETNVFQAAKAAGVIKRTINNALMAKVKDASGNPMGAVADGSWDMERPLTADCTVELFAWETPEGKAAFWHSSAHILGHAMELVYGGWLTIGPPLDDGFYYDMYTGTEACGEARTASEVDFAAIEAKINESIAKKGHGMCNRIEVSKEQALELFGYNKFKVEMINDLMAAGTTTSVYRVGDFVDLCRGPHIPSSKSIVAMKCTKLGAAYWRGSADNDSLQRVYGISFPDKKGLKAWELKMEEAKKRDHRLVGVKQELFFFNTISPGSAFFFPHGARLYNTLMNFIKEQYWQRGYDEVITPNMFSLDLWEVSGHAAKYKDDMFLLDVENGGKNTTFGLKPMNCPGHCMMFRERKRSFRELPIRYADFGAWRGAVVSARPAVCLPVCLCVSVRLCVCLSACRSACLSDRAGRPAPELVPAPPAPPACVSCRPNWRPDLSIARGTTDRPNERTQAFSTATSSPARSPASPGSGGSSRTTPTSSAPTTR
eukprot:SAG22_NODE_1673_length_3836_cov_3.441263_1_plen_545_part_00